MRASIKPFVLGLFTAAALAGGVAAWSHGAMGGPMGMHGDPAEHAARIQQMITSHLALDATQQAKLGVLSSTLLAQRGALHGSGDLHAEMQTLVQQNAFDRTRAQQLFDAKLVAMRDGGPQVIAALGDFYDSLRPDQQQKVRDFMAQHPGMHGMHSG